LVGAFINGLKDFKKKFKRFLKDLLGGPRIKAFLMKIKKFRQAHNLSKEN